MAAAGADDDRGLRRLGLRGLLPRQREQRPLPRRAGGRRPRARSPTSSAWAGHPWRAPPPDPRASGTTARARPSPSVPSRSSPSVGVGAGGGGYSEVWARTVVAAVHDRGRHRPVPRLDRCRTVPDLVYPGDPRNGAAVAYWDGAWDGFGGTSVDAPTTAGFLTRHQPGLLRPGRPGGPRALRRQQHL